MSPQSAANEVEHIHLHRLARTFYLEPLALEESSMLAVHSVLWPRISSKDGSMVVSAAATTRQDKPYALSGAAAHRRPAMAAPKIDFWTGSTIDPRYYYTLPGRADVAVVPISGMIVKGASSFEETCMGAVSTERISHALQQVSADGIKKLVLDINSPGGQVTGIQELANQIRTFAQARGSTVYAFSDQMIASAAYWLASQANEIITTGTAKTGSIGTYLAWLNENVKMQTQGVKLELFKVGTHKGLGLPGNELSQDDRAYLQRSVEDTNAQFVGAVKAGRPRISEHAVTHAAMYAGITTIPGGSALEHRLIDGVAASWEDFVAAL